MIKCYMDCVLIVTEYSVVLRYAIRGHERKNYVTERYRSPQKAGKTWQLGGPLWFRVGFLAY